MGDASAALDRVRAGEAVLDALMLRAKAVARLAAVREEWGQDPVPALASAEADLDRALAVAPPGRRPFVFLQRSAVRRSQGWALEARGREAEEHLKGALDDLNAAWAIPGRSEEGLERFARETVRFGREVVAEGGDSASRGGLQAFVREASFLLAVRKEPGMLRLRARALRRLGRTSEAEADIQEALHLETDLKERLARRRPRR